MAGGGGERKRVAELREARIIGVEPAAYTYRVQFLRGEEPADVVASYHPYMSIRGGAWMGAQPEVGDVCLVASTSWGETYSILGFKPLPRVETDPGAEEQTSWVAQAPRSDYSAGRGLTQPGDMGMWGAAGNSVAVRRSGVVDVVADEVTFTRWFPDEHAIRTACATMEMQGFFGGSTWYTLRDEAREAEGATPTGYSAWVKTHAEAAPIVNVELGAVVGDEELRLPGPDLPHDRRRGSVCFRFAVYAQEFADRYAQLGRPPDTAGARFMVRVDEQGNCEWLQAAHLSLQVGEMTQHVVGREVREVGGSSTTRVVGDLDIEALSTGRLHASRSLRLETSGDLVLACGRFIVEGDNDTVKVRRDYRVAAGGNMAFEAAGTGTFRASSDLVLSSGASSSQVTGGRHVHDVLNRADFENLGRDVTAWRVKVHSGAARLQALKGSIELAIGPADAPLATLTLHADPKIPTQVGRIVLGFPLTRTGLTLSPDGSWQLESTTGAVKCDATGRIQLGNKTAPVTGNVVTTLSHPQDYITGLPILGHADVVVGAGPVAPLPSAPSLGVQPPTVRIPEEPGA